MSRLLCIGIIVSVLLSIQAVSADSLFKADEPRPADAVVLFDGKDLSGWLRAGTNQRAGWKVENGYVEVNGTGNIVTKQEFGSYQLHLEYWLPLMADAKGQARSNSGVFLGGCYEVQILDSYGLNSQWDDCGGIYKVAAPLVNACRPPEQWQTYDMIFHASTFDKDGEKLANAKLTVVQNGVLIQDNIELPAATPGGISPDDSPAGPILLQDHGCKVRYRSIWLRALK